MKIHELLNRPERWTQEVMARDINGETSRLRGNEAVSWCLLGAMFKCYPNENERLEVGVKIKRRIDDNIVDFNDNGTYKQVYNLVKELDV